jgi:hypothetical protein
VISAPAVTGPDIGRALIHPKKGERNVGFTAISDVSKFWNAHDKGEGIPNPVICDSFFDPNKANRTTNAELTIYFRIWFEALNSGTGQIPDYDGAMFSLGNWGSDADFAGWCRDTCASAQSSWDDKLTLITPARYDGIDWSTDIGVWRPNVRCRFVCFPGDAKYHHAHIKVCMPLARPDNKVFRSFSRMWKRDDGGNTTRPYPGGGPAAEIRQNVASHEIGHLLGLHHIGGVVRVKDCVMATETASAANACYGATDTEPSFANNIMGMGMTVTEHNSLPWRQEMCKHANRHETFGELKANEWAAKVGTGAAVGPQQIKWNK